MLVIVLHFSLICHFRAQWKTRFARQSQQQYSAHKILQVIFCQKTQCPRQRPCCLSQWSQPWRAWCGRRGRQPSATWRRISRLRGARPSTWTAACCGPRSIPSSGWRLTSRADPSPWPGGPPSSSGITGKHTSLHQAFLWSYSIFCSSSLEHWYLIPGKY